MKEDKNKKKDDDGEGEEDPFEADAEDKKKIAKNLKKKRKGEYIYETDFLGKDFHMPMPDKKKSKKMSTKIKGEEAKDDLLNE